MPYQESVSFEDLKNTEFTKDIEENDYIMILKKKNENRYIYCVTKNKLNYKENQDVTLIHEKTYSQIAAKIVYIFSLQDYDEKQTRLEIQHDIENLGIDITKNYPIKKIV